MTYRIFLTLFIVASCTFAQGQVVVNEVCASNRWINNTPPVPLLSDNYGENEDWFELYNTTGAAVDISGWWLGNRPGNPLKWQIPAGTSIPANGYKIVFCSKRDEASGGYLHTNFTLQQTDDDHVMLSDAAGTLVDEFIFSSANRTQLTHSRGRTTSGAATWSLFTNPTPGAANAGAAAEYPAKPTLNPAAGFYAGAQNVTIAGPAGATIRYTTNGSEPTATSTAYAGPIPVNTTTVIRAAAFTAGGVASFIETNTYFIGVTHSVDVISASGDDLLDLLGGNGGIQPWGSFEYFGSNGAQIDEAVGEFNEHGQDSWAYGQRGVDYITRDESGHNYAVQHQIFNTTDRDKFQKLIIKASAGDNFNFGPGQPAHIRDQYVQALSQVGGLEVDERSYQPCVFYVNGQYWGVYDLREKVDDHDFTRYYYDQDKYDLQFLKTWGGTWSEYGGPQAQNDWNALRNYIMTNDMGDAAAFAYVDGQYNWKSLVDYFCLNSYTVCSDWLNWNTGWWRGQNPGGGAQKWRYILWDMDATFDHYANFTGIPDESANADPCDPEQLNDPGGQGHTEILTKLIEENQMVHDYYVNRYADLGNTLFSCDFMIAFLDSLVATIEPEMPGQIARWGGTMAQWQANVQEIRDFIEDRCVLIQDGMVDCYDLVGPFNVCFNVDPPLSGTMQINSLNPDTYPFCGLYYGGIATTLAPIPETGWMFSHWEVFSTNVITPTLTDSLVTVDILSADSIVAHFVPQIEYEVIFNVDPGAAGSISIDGFVPGVYVYIDSIQAGTELELAPIPAPGWVFSHWEVFGDNDLLPTTTDSLVTIIIMGADSIVAHFIPEISHRLVFNVDPPMSGSISIDGDIPPIYPFDDEYGQGFTLQLYPIPAFEWRFTHWEVFASTTMLPSMTDSLVSMEVVEPDSIVAHFEPSVWYDVMLDVVPREGGNIVFDGVTYSQFPSWVTVPKGFEKEFHVEPKTYYDFLHWSVKNNVYQPDDSTVTQLFARFYSHDTIIAYLDPQEYVFFTPNAFTPNGDGLNDKFIPLANVLDLETYDLTIYDRWGQLLYATTDPSSGWDGTAGGSLVPNGVYVFRAEMTDAIKRDRYEVFGHVTVVR
jgi:gliding motility-associated-like protein